MLLHLCYNSTNIRLLIIMNLETAQKIINEEALLLVIKYPNIGFNLENGYTLSRLFNFCRSAVVNRMNAGFNGSYVLRIDHPEHGLGFYSAGYPGEGVKVRMVRLTDAGDFEEII